MKLNAITTYGFKSFADKTEIVFQDGITAVIGPNGSGKSNIADSVRFVLGEQSVKNLRGSKMEDVIFAGTSSRRALSMAEVTLSFDNEQGIIPLEHKEVVVGRRIYRSGESEYFINKSNCRLKDIIDVFSDTGLGKASFAIISQNKVDEILNAKPEERRKFIEEVSGITKYKQRKREAVLRLESTQNNLLRIFDIKSEVENQLEPMRINAVRTEQYNHFYEIRRYCQINLGVAKLEQLLKSIEWLDQDMGEQVTVQDMQAAKISAEENKVFLVNESIVLQDNIYREKQNDYTEAKARIEQLVGKQNLLTERMENNYANIEHSKNSIQKVREQVKNFADNIDALAEKKAQLETALSEKKLDLAAVEQEYETINKRGKQLLQDIGKINADVAKLKVWQNLQNNYDGFGNSVKHILKSSEHWRSGVVGVVAEQLQVPKEYIVAIETALGGSSQHIITENEEIAKSAIEFLKTHKYGRATFLPLTTIKVPQKNNDQDILQLPGAIDYASNLVSVDQKINGVVEYLLGRTIVFRDIDSALQAAKKTAFKVRLVTLSGEILYVGGSIAGGSRFKENSFFSRAVDIAELMAQIKLRVQDLKIVTMDIIGNNPELIQSLTEELANNKHDLYVLVSAVERKKNLYNEDMSNLKIELASFRQELEYSNARLAESELGISNADREILFLETEMKKLDSLIVEAKSESSKSEFDLVSKRQEVQEVEQALKAVNQTKFSLLQNKQELEKNIILLKREYNNQQQIINTLAIKKVKLESERENLLNDLLEKYNIDYAGAKDFCANNAMEIDNFSQSEKEARSELERIGSVNPNAIEEYKVQCERFKFLTEQYRDLETGKKSLEKIIEDIDKVMLQKFSETLQRVNIFFLETFQKIFGGGIAELKLLDNEDKLSAGLEIYVEPPGKKLQTISLLSGGERALTVIALLFALLAVKPAPFCILDEVDAALDEANVERLCLFLKEYADKTQFIVITHRKPTMEAAKVLYGITMQEAGVSKVLSVKISDVEDYK